MKITTKCRYGTKAIIEIARNYNIRPTTRKDISVHQNIPDSYLENILIDLKKSGIINSIRGTKGGFILNRSPKEITLYDIFKVLKKSINPVGCIKDPDICCCTEFCITRPVWQKMYESQKEILKSFSIQNLLDKDTGDERHSFSYC